MIFGNYIQKYECDFLKYIHPRPVHKEPMIKFTIVFTADFIYFSSNSTVHQRTVLGQLQKI